MRAGLLSHRQVVERLSKDFVPTWILIDDARRLSEGGDSLAKTVAEQWDFPLDVMFFAPNGRFLSKLNSFRDFRDAHPDVGHPPEGRGRADPHLEVFLDHLEQHFGKR